MIVRGHEAPIEPAEPGVTRQVLGHDPAPDDGAGHLRAGRGGLRARAPAPPGHLRRERPLRASTLDGRVTEMAAGDCWFVPPDVAPRRDGDRGRRRSSTSSRRRGSIFCRRRRGRPDRIGARGSGLDRAWNSDSDGARVFRPGGGRSVSMICISGEAIRRWLCGAVFAVVLAWSAAGLPPQRRTGRHPDVRSSCWRSRWRSSRSSPACTRACSSRRRRSRRSASAREDDAQGRVGARARDARRRRPGASPRRRGRRSAARRTTSALADRRREPRLRHRAGPEVPGGREGVDARGHRLRALGLHVQQAEHRPRRGTPAVRDRLGVRPAVRRVDADERARIRRRSSATPGLVYDAFAPKPKRQPQLHAEPQLHSDRRPRRHRARAHGRVGRRAEVGRPGPRAPSPRGAAAQPRRLLLRGHRVLDLLRAVARALPRRVGALHRREPLGPRPVQELEVLRSPTRSCRTARPCSTSATSGRAR